MTTVQKRIIGRGLVIYYHGNNGSVSFFFIDNEV